MFIVLNVMAKVFMAFIYKVMAIIAIQSCEFVDTYVDIQWKYLTLQNASSEWAVKHNDVFSCRHFFEFDFKNTIFPPYAPYAIVEYNGWQERVKQKPCCAP